jgi:hypothetical protein
MNNHPIIPPKELVEQWIEKTVKDNYIGIEDVSDLVNEASQWGSDQELEACCEWLRGEYDWGLAAALRLDAERRPEPPSLKEQALKQLDEISTCFRVTHMGDIVCDKIREALEAL